MPPHLLRCQGLAVGDYSFALGRLSKIPLAGEAGAPSTFAQLGSYIAGVPARRLLATIVSENFNPN